MIIIEETEEDRNRVSVPDEEYVEDEVLSTEEEKYRSARDLEDSLECVTRYEQGVRTLLDAAALFEEISDYGDSARRAAACRKRAQTYENKGKEKAYQEAVKLFKNAKTKMDYRTAITELERFSDYKESADMIRQSKEVITRLETRSSWKNRMIAVVIISVMVIFVWIVWKFLI